MFISKIMTSDPITVAPTISVLEAVNTMKVNGFRRLPITEGKKLVGIVTDRDLRQASPSPATSLSVHEINYILAKMQLKDVMKKKVLTIDVDATIEEAALIMYTNKIGGLVVVNQDKEVAGVITETDLFKCFVEIMGISEGRTRYTMEFVDRIGAFHELTGVFKDMGINIFSMATYHLAEGRVQMVVRADTQDTKELPEKLAAKGFPVMHMVQIGG